MRHLLAVLLLAGCAVPPPDAYVSGGRGRPDQAVDLGANVVGEACVQNAGADGVADVYCGAWQQPSARVRAAGPGDASTLATLAAAGPWRTALDARYVCAAPAPATVDGQPALRLDCTRRVGGWPHVALVAALGGQAWLADGVVPAVPAMERSIAVLSGRAPARVVASGAANALQAERQAARARVSGDVREFDALMRQGLRANLADNPAASEAAYAAAVAVQEKALGRDNPNLADPLARMALQLSNQGRYAEAEAAFARAARLAPGQRGDTTLAPRLLHYEGLHLLNQGKREGALARLREAEAGYLATVPAEALRYRRPGGVGLAAQLDGVLASPAERDAEAALGGAVETRRYQAVLLRDLNRLPEAEAAMRAAYDLARNSRLERPELTARLSRTAALGASAGGNSELAMSEFAASNSAFNRAYPGSRPLALVGLLRARELMAGGRVGDAVDACRASLAVLVEIKSGFEPERMSACLDAYAAAAARDAGARQGLLQEMFLAAQLVRSSRTEQQINQAAARLGEGSRDTRVGQAIREQQDAAAALLAIRRQREVVAQAQRDGVPPPPGVAGLEEREREALEQLAARESDLQAAAPNYGQLVGAATPAADVLRTLQPGEAFLAVTLDADSGWTFLLRDGTVRVGRVRGGAANVDALVRRIRAAMTPATPAFDTAAAHDLYRAVLGEVEAGLDGVTALTVAPSGGLLSVPFGILLARPADPGALAQAAWLARAMTIGHVPSAGNFVALRRVAPSEARRPWFGFGDFRPVSLAQARRTYGAGCGDTADVLARLPPLPSARRELDIAADQTGATGQESLRGAAFTAAAVRRLDLSSYRILHFASHALLPTDLACQTEPAIVTSPPANAPDAAGALLRASDLAQIKLDADLVILSACSTGGADGALGGESLSALARSFFYGGARSLVITHWEVDDSASSLIVSLMLKSYLGDRGAGLAAALQKTQRFIFDREQPGIPSEFAHPYYWAPFALIGPAGGVQSGRVASMRL